MKLETHAQMKSRHQKEFSQFKGIFWAFSDEQFVKGMKSLGLTPHVDEHKLIAIGAGGYILKEVKDSFHSLFARQADERKNRLKDEKALIESLVYELANHEYCITGDPTDAIESLGMEMKDVPAHILTKAINAYMGSIS